MTSAHLDDDAVSALLDGEATSEEAAHAVVCDACSERMARFRDAAAQIGDPGPVDEVARERAIAAALGAQVVPLRSRRRELPPWLVGAAALIVLALVLVPLLGDTDHDQEDRLAGGDAAARDEESALDASAPEVLTAPTPAGSEAADTTLGMRATEPVAGGHLGEVDDSNVDERVRAALLGPSPTTAGADATATTAAANPDGPCEEALRSGDAELGNLRMTGTAEVEGRRATIVVYDVSGSDPPALRAYIVAGEGCDVLLASTFPAAA